MIYYENANATRLNEFIKYYSAGKLQENAQRAAEYACISKDIYNEYVVIRIQSHYNIVHTSFENYIQTINNVAYPFDEERIYPPQKIKQVIEYDY